MEGAALVGVVDQSPFLDVAELHLDIDTVHRELFAVEIELRLCIRLGHRRGSVEGLARPPRTLR